MSAPVCAAVALLMACSKSAAPPDSQIAVKVNKGEISVHQVQAVLQRQPRLPPDAAGNAAQRVLEVLVDQELAAQAAQQQGLESDPGVIQQLQAARRETLARAYHDRVAAKAANPSSDEIDRYYESKPALFAQRRLYLLQESAVEANAAQLPVLQDGVARAQSAEELAKLLQGAALRHTTRQFTQAAEDLPLLLLDPISKLNPGQSALFPQPGGARIFTVLQAHRAPVDRRTATEPIARFLIADRKRELVSQSMAALRKDAKLQYEGAFAKTAAGAASGAQAAPAASAPR
jgi:EpsD family peptidyl-prolyl cis-trans isomerase